MKGPCLEAESCVSDETTVLYRASVKIFWCLMTGHSCDPGELWVSWAQERRGAGVLTLTKPWLTTGQCNVGTRSFSSHSYPGHRHEEYHGHSPTYDTTHATTNWQQLHIVTVYCIALFISKQLQELQYFQQEKNIPQRKSWRWSWNEERLLIDIINKPK